MSVDFSAKGVSDVADQQCSINWSLMASSSEYLSNSQFSPRWRSRVMHSVCTDQPVRLPLDVPGETSAVRTVNFFEGRNTFPAS